MAMSNEFPFSEEFRLAGEDWAKKEAEANFMEETKSALMAQRQSMLGDIAVNKAEQMVKASRDWMDYLTKIATARKEANFAKIKMEAAKLRFYEMQTREANSRTEARL